MISNITNTFIKAKKAFDISQFTESKNLLNEVIKHDKDFLSAYLMLYEIYDKTNSKKKNMTSTVTFPKGNIAPEGSVVKSTAIDKTVIDEDGIEKILQRKVFYHDKIGDNHYDLISALHKSIRGSDPDAGLFWLARALNAGEDPFYIFRRLLRISIEDVGLANPESQRLVLDSWNTYEKLGSPEGDIALAMSVILLSLLY